MATRKLSVELDVDTSKAKRRLKELSATGGADGGGEDAISPAAKKAAEAMNRAAKEASKFGEEAREGSDNLGRAVKVFGGMAVHLAAGYASRMMAEGSAGRYAVEAAGNIVGGAIAGSAAGPWGAAAGAAVGAAKSAIDITSSEEDRQLETALEQVKALSENKGGSPFRASESGLDALARIGGAMGDGNFGRDQLNVQREMATTLKSIDLKTRTGGGGWQ